jgi:hypothetical protein
VPDPSHPPSPPPDPDERLARIEAHLAAIRHALETPPERPGRLGAALRRFVVGTWVAGLLGIAAVSWVAGLEALRNPGANVCASADAADYAECRREPAGDSDSLLSSLRNLVRSREVDPARVVRRYETERHADSRRRLVAAALAWSLVSACALVLVAWASPRG